jgi:hypothetical protein
MYISDENWFFNKCNKTLIEVRHKLVSFFKRKELNETIRASKCNNRFMFTGINYRIHGTFDFTEKNHIVQIHVFDFSTLDKNSEGLSWNIEYAKVVLNYEVNSPDDLGDDFKEWLIKNSMEWLFKKPEIEK